MQELKGSYAQVVEPALKTIMAAYEKSYMFWGKLDYDVEKVQVNYDLIGFIVHVKTSRANFDHIFKRSEDLNGLFYWQETEVKEVQ